MAMLFGTIAVGNGIARMAPKTKEAETPVKTVAVFGVGQAPRVTVNATVEKTGVVKVMAQSGGVVQAVYAREGDSVAKGFTIAWLSTNPQGGTIPSYTRQIAEQNYTFVSDNYDSQMEMITKRREVAERTNNLAGDTREMTQASIANTTYLISLNEEILASLTTQISDLEASNIGGANDALILQAKQGRAGVVSALNSLKGAVASAQYQSDEQSEPGHLSNLARDIATKQLDLEERSLKLNMELSKLNLSIAQIGESLMFPASPVSGVVERVYVQPGQYLSANTPVALVKGASTTTSVVALVPEITAKRLSRIEPSTIYVGETSFRANPIYISDEATDGRLFAVRFAVPDEYQSEVVAGGIVRVELPIGSLESTNAVPFVPLDAVYQSENTSYVFIATTSAGMTVAQSKEVNLGQVFGQYVTVNSGMSGNDVIITDRTVISGDKVKYQE